MKKVLPVIFLLVTCYLLLATSVFAACNPPQDYSTCSLAQTGPKIAANINPRNYQQIREQYNKANPALTNQQIPVTVIYTTADLSPANLQNTVSNLQAMQQYGLHPVIRVSSSVIGAQGWDRITLAEAQTAAQSLNQALSAVHFSQKPVVYFGNEPNLRSEWGGQADADSFAQAFAAFIQSAGPGRQFQVFIPPVATHQGGVEYNFMQQILNYRLPNGQTIAQSVDGVAFTIYNDNSQTLSSLYQQLSQFYQRNGINNFVISEIGPLVNGRLLQGPGDINRWASIMSRVFADIKNNPGLFQGAQFISTSFFLDTDGDGFPDVTLLVVIDKDGNVIILELATLGGGILTSQKFGVCQADQPFTSGVETKGKSFPVKLISCFGSVQDPAQAIEAFLKTTKLEFPNNQKIAQHLHEETLAKLKPYDYRPAVLEKTALGKITYEVCQEGTTNWYTVEKEVEFKTEEWVAEMATTGQELAKMLVPGGGGLVAGESATTLASANPSSQLLAQAQEAGNIPHGCKYYLANRWDPVNNRPDCSCMARGTCRAEHGCCPMHWWWGICGWDDCQPNARCSVSELQQACPGQTFQPGPTVTPTPKLCQRYDPSGEGIVPEVICVAGECTLKDTLSNPAHDFFQSLLRAGWETSQAIQEALTRVGLCHSTDLIVIPHIQTPYVQTADTTLRPQTLSIFKVPSADAQKAFEFQNALEEAQHEFRASPPTGHSSETEIFGQAGVKNAYDWVQQALSPYNSGLTQTSTPTSLTYSLPFHDPTVSISALARATVIAQVKQRWPQTKIEAFWNEVFNQSVSHGWNPAFVIALWIEESGASGVDAYDLGCLGASKNNLSAQLDCLFSRPYANESFEEFMCQYSEGESAPCVFSLNQDFPKNLKYWYDFLTNQR